MLRWRLLLGVLLIAALAGLCWLDFHASHPGLWLGPLSLVLAALSSGELLWMLNSQSLRPAPWLVYGGNLLIVASSWGPVWTGRWPTETPLEALAWPLASFTLAVLAAFALEMWRYERPGGATVRLSVTLLSLAYVGLLISFLVALRLLGGGRLGMGLLLALVAVVKLGDIGAYTLGRMFGRHKMAPQLSPGKTIEGALGGVLFACGGAWLAWNWLLPRLVDRPATPHEVGWLEFGIVVGLAGIAGDLAESLLKRDLGQKDSSAWMPGFGGVLDVLDSILFAAPVAYFCWLLG